MSHCQKPLWKNRYKPLEEGGKVEYDEPTLLATYALRFEDIWSTVAWQPL